MLEKNNLRKGKRAEASDGWSSNWKSRAEFGNLTYWNHDTLPSLDDPLVRCFHWFAVADALHKSITAEELCSTVMIPGPNNPMD
ncbi:ribonuclease H2 subunit C [Iris pallida]|uniref:Ribonuclease H2 subunit C n=1 Tax=Iris pallida TaxID=29817 RepID=A0AAX6G1Y1_IRIPA|nr:ribonuclease H2 subunit C [Iris pallida]